MVKHVAPTLLALAALGAAAAPAAAAPPGTIAYVKDANVFLAAPDGSRVHQVTKDGTPGPSRYVSPSLAPDGTIWAGQLNSIVHLDQAGKVLAKLDPPDHPINGAGIGGTPEWVDVSPDGKRIAYGYVHPACPGTGRPCSTTGITNADAVSPVQEYGTHDLVREASWFSNTDLIATRGRELKIIRNLRNLEHWTNLPDDYFDWAISPDLKRAANVSSDGAQRWGSAWWIPTVPGAELPRPVCDLAPVADAEVDPVWSPDSSSLAWAAPSGILWLQFAADYGPGKCNVVAEGLVGAPGAREPDWANVAIDPPAQGGNPPGGNPPGGNPPVSKPPAAVAPGLRLATGRSTRPRLTRSGLTFRVGCAAACTFSAKLTLPRKAAKRVGLSPTVARTSGAVAAGAAKTIRVKLSSRTRARLRRLGKDAGRLRLAVTATNAGGKETATARVGR